MQCRYGIALAGMSLAVLIGEGWQGPLTVMLTLALPPDIKSFAISLWSGITNLIGPTTSTLFGMYLTVTPRLTGILPFTASWLKPFLCTVQVIHCFTIVLLRHHSHVSSKRVFSFAACTRTPCGIDSKMACMHRAAQAQAKIEGVCAMNFAKCEIQDFG